MFGAEVNQGMDQPVWNLPNVSVRENKCSDLLGMPAREVTLLDQQPPSSTCINPHPSNPNKQPTPVGTPITQPLTQPTPHALSPNDTANQTTCSDTRGNGDPARTDPRMPSPNDQPGHR